MSTYTRYTQHPTIELCRRCSGSGTHYTYDNDDILNQKPIPEQCPTCNGTGRVIVSKTTTITVKPFKS